MRFSFDAPARAGQRGRGSLKSTCRGIAVAVPRAHTRPSLGLCVLVAAILLGPAAAGAQDMRGRIVPGLARIIDLVDQAAASAGVPVRIAHAVIWTESGYRPDLRGSAGEWGIGQIKCATARSVGFQGSCGQLADAATNLKFAMAYLRLALDRGGHGCAGVSLYQRGIFGRPACSSYGREVMARAGS
jgi:hypothetical protein